MRKKRRAAGTKRSDSGEREAAAASLAAAERERQLREQILEELDVPGLKQAVGAPERRDSSPARQSAK